MGEKGKKTLILDVLLEVILGRLVGGGYLSGSSLVEVLLFRSVGCFGKNARSEETEGFGLRYKETASCCRISFLCQPNGGSSLQCA